VVVDLGLDRAAYVLEDASVHFNDEQIAARTGLGRTIM
jgi:hypothetical protein